MERASDANRRGCSSAARTLLSLFPTPVGKGGVQTREQYLEMGLPTILRALRLLKKHPHYRFVLDQACYVQPFL